jgi:septum formation protein
VLVLGADTVVVIDGRVIGKPGSRKQAIEMLSRLSGRCHEVFTGVALVESSGSVPSTGYEVSRVYMRPIHAREMEAYVDTGEPMDKAGAYALQGIASAFVERIEGCFTNIIGLPVPLVVRLLRGAGVPVLGTT